MRSLAAGIIILAASLALAGCETPEPKAEPRTMQAYPGEMRPESEHAVLLVKAPTTITSIDGQPVSLGGRDVDDRVYILPGAHTVTVDNTAKEKYYAEGPLGAMMQNLNAEKRLQFDAEPGHTYRAKVDDSKVSVNIKGKGELGKTWFAHIEDAATGKRCTGKDTKALLQGR